jgi:hypothetical protein
LPLGLAKALLIQQSWQAMPMKKSNNLEEAYKAKNQVKMRLGSMEITIGHDPMVDRAILPEEMKTSEQHCSLKPDEVCCIFHGHDDMSSLMGGE